MRKKSLNHTKEWVAYLAETPLGPLRLYFSDQGLSALEFAGEESPSAPEQDTYPAHLQPLIDAAKRELTAYFAGVDTDFASLTLDPQGTPFQRRVWQELRRIPRGQAISYMELAQRVGNPRASRAVGQANGRNPIPLIIPCHRVINANGGLGGYNSGLERKRWLLRHEGAM
ncbi:MAG: methylated-DNA--[protein]-cysteine S-methyltransferase [Deltaproteobacteria bacterium]